MIPYSDHSSHAELLEFVSMLRPARVLPIVQQMRGPFGLDISDRADMSCFQGILWKSRLVRHIDNNSTYDRQLGEESTESNKDRVFLRERLAEGNMAPTYDFSPWSVCKRDQISHTYKKSGLKSGVRSRKRPATGVVYVSFSADGHMSDYSDITHPSQQHTHLTGSCTTSHPIQQHSHTVPSDITSKSLEQSVDSQQHKDILQLHVKRTAAQGIDSHRECGIVDSAASHPHSLCDCPLPGGCRKCLEEDVCADVVARCDDAGDGAHVDERMGSVEMDHHDRVTQQSLTDDSQVDNVSSDNHDFPNSFKSCHASAGQCCYRTDQQPSLTSTLSDHLPPQSKSVSPQTEGSHLLKYAMREQCVGGGRAALKPHIGVDNNLVDGACTQSHSIHLELVCGVLETRIREVDNRRSSSCILLPPCVPGDSCHAGIPGHCANISESSAASSWDHPRQELDMSGSCPELKLPLDSQNEHGAESTSFMSKFLPTASVQRGTRSTDFQMCSSGMLRQKQQILELESRKIGSVSHFIASLQEFLRKT